MRIVVGISALLCAHGLVACSTLTPPRSDAAAPPPVEGTPQGALQSALAGAPEGAIVEVAPEMAMRPARKLDDDGVFYVATEDAKHPRVRYLDGQVSLNDRCGVQLGNKLTRRIPPVYVNGQPIGFC